VVIGGYFINGYWLVDILLMDIDGFWWLLMVIGGY